MLFGLTSFSTSERIERVDAVACAAPGVGALRDAGDEARVIDEEAHVREALRHDADVAALAVLVGLLAERQSLVDADHLDAERARLLDEARADVVRQKEALAVQAPLGIGLPRAHLPALFQLVHRLEIARLVRVDAAVEQQPMRAFHAVDDPAHRIGRLDRQRLGIAARGHEREHHHVGIAVEKHVLDEFLGAEAVEITARAGFGGEPAARFGRPFESIGRRCLHPRAGGIDEVPLHVEDELALAADPRLRELRLERGFGFELEESAALPRRGVGRIEREQRARRAASRDQKIATTNAQALRVLSRRLVRQAVAGAVGRRERNGREFAVRSRIELDRQPPAFGIDYVFHRNEYRPRNDGSRMTESRFFSPPMGISRILANQTGIRTRQSTWP